MPTKRSSKICILELHYSPAAKENKITSDIMSFFKELGS